MFDLSKSNLRRVLAASTVAAVLGGIAVGGAPVSAAEGEAVPNVKWSFEGPFGKFDRAQLQRGYQVYREVCASCHSMNLVSFRNLAEPGGPEFSAEEIKALAAEFQVQDGPNDEGDMFERPGKPSDRFPSPFANEQAARSANNGSYPPDLSVIVKARPGGADYVHAVLVGYEETPEGVELREGMSYNKYFAGHQIAMPAPLSEESVEYADGSPMTVEQYAKDVTAFLAWAAEPTLESRHRMGLNVMIYLIILAGLLYATKRKLFASVDH